jgi:hypothetical protein
VIPWLFTLAILLKGVGPSQEKAAGKQVVIFSLSLLAYIAINRIEAYSRVMVYLFD